MTSQREGLNNRRFGASTGHMDAATPRPQFSFETRWSPALKKDGHVQVSTFFLNHYSKLKPYPLTHGEAMFVIHLMQYKWGADAPFPAYKTIADRMCVSVKTAQRLAKSLQDKDYLYRQFRRGETNVFHLNKLIKALEALKASSASTSRLRGPR